MPHSKPLEIHQPPLSLPEVVVHASSWINIERWDCSMAVEAYWKLYWSEQRAARVHLDGIPSVEMEPGHLLLVPPGLRHAGKSFRHLRLFFVHFSFDLPLRAPPRGVWRVKADTPVRERIGLVLDALRSGDLHAAPAIHFGVRELIHHSLGTLPSGTWDPHPRDPRLSKAMDLMIGALPETLPNTELARAAGVSASGLLRLFRDTTGLSPQAWQLQRRIESACLLLQHGDDPIDGVAELTGFYDRQHFSRHFKRHTGMTPARYRRQFAPFHAPLSETRR